ncbi:hypothetical protein VKT23_007946 [Stygiomarasmius scandens]|uniref:Major facilitator superfamily (MFS) profile domain-containing protein n=1 Tax=Marasmiellus scandens TaxID=2682957 RepID=A0ABR1JK15_9AGAR
MLASESGRVSYDTFEDHGHTTRSASVEFIRDEERDEETRKAVRKIDVAILPVMTIFYLLSFLDRANIGNARVAGLQRDLGMSDHQYSVAVTVLFIPYILSEIPANLLLRKIGPSILLPALLTVWGVIVTLQGSVTTYAELVALRVLLGAVEGPMAPGIVLYLSGFYTRKELSLRVAIFFSAASIAGAFSGLLAAAIVNMDGLRGKAGWSWIFIIEGVFTVVIGLLGFFLVPPSPEKARFLSAKQKELIIHRIDKDRPATSTNYSFTIHEVFRSMSSPHVLLVFIIFYLEGTNASGIALFLPSIINQMGFGANESQLLSVGPYAGGVIVTLLSAFFSDRFNTRAIPIAMIYSLAIAGFALYLGADDKFTRYGSLYLSVSGVYASTPIIYAWLSNNSEPHYRRATSIALGVIATNSGGITSTWLYPSNEAPAFRKAIIINLVFAILVILTSALNALILSRANRLKREKRIELLAPYLEHGSVEPDGGLKAWVELGDKHPDYVYTI